MEDLMTYRIRIGTFAGEAAFPAVIKRSRSIMRKLKRRRRPIKDLHVKMFLWFGFIFLLVYVCAPSYNDSVGYISLSNEIASIEINVNYTTIVSKIVYYNISSTQSFVYQTSVLQQYNVHLSKKVTRHASMKSVTLPDSSHTHIPTMYKLTHLDYIRSSTVTRIMSMDVSILSLVDNDTHLNSLALSSAFEKCMRIGSAPLSTMTRMLYKNFPHELSIIGFVNVFVLISMRKKNIEMNSLMTLSAGSGPCDYLLGNKGSHSYHGNMMREGSPTSGTSSDDVVYELHNKMVTDLDNLIAPSKDETLNRRWKQFTQHLHRPDLLSEVEISNLKDMCDVFRNLVSKGKVNHGKYDTVKKILSDLRLNQCLDIVTQCEEDIKVHWEDSKKVEKKSTAEAVAGEAAATSETQPDKGIATETETYKVKIYDILKKKSTTEAVAEEFKEKLEKAVSGEVEKKSTTEDVEGAAAASETESNEGIATETEMYKREMKAELYSYNDAAFKTHYRNILTTYGETMLIIKSEKHPAEKKLELESKALNVANESLQLVENMQQKFEKEGIKISKLGENSLFLVFTFQSQASVRQLWNMYIFRELLPILQEGLVTPLVLKKCNINSLKLEVFIDKNQYEECLKSIDEQRGEIQTKDEGRGKEGTIVETKVEEEKSQTFESVKLQQTSEVDPDKSATKLGPTTTLGKADGIIKAEENQRDTNGAHEDTKDSITDDTKSVEEKENGMSCDQTENASSTNNVEGAVSEDADIEGNSDGNAEVHVTRQFALTRDSTELLNILYQVQNQLYVWFYKSNNVLVVTLDGNILRTIPLHASIADGIYIQGICLSLEDRTIWSATSNRRIQQTGFDGRELCSIETFVVSGEERMRLCLCSKNKLVIGTYFNGDKVMVINENGEVIKSIQPENIGLTESPIHIKKCKKSGNMAFLEWLEQKYISVTDEHFEHLYNLYGDTVTLSNGTTALTGYKGNAKFEPWFSCYDDDGNLIVSEANSFSVLLFSGNGHFIRVLTSENEASSRPCGIGPHSGGLIWIALQNNQVKQIRTGQVIAEIVRGKIELQEVDVIVCAVNNSFNLAASGTVAKCLLAVGGNSLMEECKSRCLSGTKQGEVVPIESGNLKCKKVYFISLPDFLQQDTDRGRDVEYYGVVTEKEQILKTAISKIVDKAVADQMKSIAFPAIGISMNLSTENVARIMFNTIKEKKSEFRAIIDVRFVLLDRNVIKVFKDIEKEIL